MKCDICHVRDATVHLTEVVNDKVAKLHLCEECAKSKSEEMQSHFGLTDLIASLMDFAPTLSDANITEEKAAKCSRCGMTYYDFQRLGKLGCEKCYDDFKDDLSVLLRKIHGSDKHVGKMPFMGINVAKEQEVLKRLKNELDELIHDEEFEKAVMLRDRIRELEGKINGEEKVR